jgi:hypothetical protein
LEGVVARHTGSLGSPVTIPSMTDRPVLDVDLDAFERAMATA